MLCNTYPYIKQADCCSVNGSLLPVDYLPSYHCLEAVYPVGAFRLKLIRSMFRTNIKFVEVRTALLPALKYGGSVPYKP